MCVVRTDVLGQPERVALVSEVRDGVALCATNTRQLHPELGAGGDATANYAGNERRCKLSRSCGTSMIPYVLLFRESKCALTRFCAGGRIFAGGWRVARDCMQAGAGHNKRILSACKPSRKLPCDGIVVSCNASLVQKSPVATVYNMSCHVVSATCNCCTAVCGAVRRSSQLQGTHERGWSPWNEAQGHLTCRSRLWVSASQKESFAVVEKEEIGAPAQSRTIEHCESRQYMLLLRFSDFTVARCHGKVARSAL